MIKLLLKSGSFIFHPLWLPTYAMLYYFFNVSFMFTYENMVAKVLAVILLTVFVPIFFLILLKPLKIIDDLYLEKVKQRRIPLLFFTTISAFIINYIFDPVHFRIPFYFFSAVFFCGIVCVLLSFLNYKISLHAVGISNLVTFIIGFSLLYHIDDLWFISLMILAMGWVISSRIVFKAHKIHELFTGTLLGISSQIIFMQFWFV